jgi:hypothetical protein
MYTVDEKGCLRNFSNLYGFSLVSDVTVHKRSGIKAGNSPKYEPTFASNLLLEIIHILISVFFLLYLFEPTTPTEMCQKTN